MRLRSTRTSVTLEVSPEAYAEIRRLLEAAGYGHAFMREGEGELIDMHGIALAVARVGELERAVAAELGVTEHVDRARARYGLPPLGQAMQSKEGMGTLKEQTIGGPAMGLEDDLEAVAQKIAPKLTREAIEARIASVEYLWAETAPGLTIAVVTMENTFTVIGSSRPASDANFDPLVAAKVSRFDPLVAQRFAYEDAIRQLWPLEGYLLRDRQAISDP